MIRNDAKHLQALGFLLPRKSKIKLSLLVGVQSLLSVLDLGGLLIVGWIATLSVSKLQGGSQSDSLLIFFKILNIHTLNFEEQIMIVCVLALLFFTMKTIISLYLLQRVYSFLAFEVVRAGERTLTSLFHSPRIEFRKEKPQQLLASVTSGIVYLVLGYLGSQVVILTDIFLLIMIGAATFFVEPIVAIFAFTYFALVIFFINRHLSKRSKMLGQKIANASINSNQQILDSFAIYKELYLLNDFNFAIKEYSKLRTVLSYTNAKLMFLPNVSKYVLEMSLVLGVALVAALEYFTNTPLEAIRGVAIFFVASTRAFPALLRSQAASITAKHSLGFSQITVDYLHTIGSQHKSYVSSTVKLIKEFRPNIIFKNVTFQHSANSHFRFQNISFNVPEGSKLGIAGPSGGGKSSLIDLILGLNLPQDGEVLISGKSPRETITNFPGGIAYVPQDIRIIQGTLLHNILLGRKCETEKEKLWLEELLLMTGLNLEIGRMTDGLNTRVGPKEIALSGGQRQRVGIARALYSKPALIILDEATSALDAIAEGQISRMIFELNKKSTIIVVAHRLSTLMECDQIIYLNEGRIDGIGSFESLKKTNIEFREQATIFGL